MTYQLSHMAPLTRVCFIYYYDLEMEVYIKSTMVQYKD